MNSIYAGNDYPTGVNPDMPCGDVFHDNDKDGKVSIGDTICPVECPPT